MRVDLDKNLDKDVFHTIKTSIGYPAKSAWNKISYVIFCKLAQITKKLIISGRLCLPLTKNLSNTSVIQNYLLTLHRLQIFYLRHYKVIIFDDNNDDIIDDVNNNLVPRVVQ